MALAAGPAAAADVPLDRDPGSYFALAMRQMRLKNLTLAAPGCHVGINCVGTGGCGLLRMSGATIGAPGQVVSDRLCTSESFFQVFSNTQMGCASPTCGMISHPGTGFACTEPFVPPILPDADLDGDPSCAPGCNVDPDDVAAVCDVTLPLPDCDPDRDVSVFEDEDCPPYDVLPGNERCDLAPGAYGSIRIPNGGRLDFGAGETVICDLKARNAVRLTSAGPARVVVPGRGKVRINNAADVGGDCGDLRIVSERGLIRFGRHGDFNLDACTIEGKLKLGRGNNLRGHFVAHQVASDFNNDGFCCPPTASLPPPPPTTTTSTTTSTSDPGSTTTTTTDPGTTTTTTDPGTTTTTTTADPGSTTTTTTTSSTTTTSTSSTTTSTVPGAWTRTAGFYKTHPDITESILAGSGGVTVCGRSVLSTALDDCRSALEGLCVEVRGQKRRQLTRQLLAAALTGAAGGAGWVGFAACDAVCADAGASHSAISACIDAAAAFNQSGDHLMAPFAPGSADPRPCEKAFRTACALLEPGACSVCP